MQWWPVDTTKKYSHNSFVFIYSLRLYLHLIKSYCRKGVLTPSWSCRRFSRSRSIEAQLTPQVFWVVKSLFFVVLSVCFFDKQLSVSQFVSRWLYAWNLEAMSAETCDSSNDLTWVSCGFLHEECAHVYQQRAAEVFVDMLFLACFSVWGTIPVFWIGRKNRILRLESIVSWTASSKRSSSGALFLWLWMHWPTPPPWKRTCFTSWDRWCGLFWYVNL